MRDTLLACDNLTKRYGKQTVIDGLTMQVQRGDVVGLLGLNGAGKTTLLECVLGYSLPDTGMAQICGRDSLQLDATTRLRLGFVPQRDELLDAMTAPQYVALIAGFYPGWNHSLIERLLREWDVPQDKRIGTLSVGQRQKLSIISALGHEPELLILDEPVASLDPMARRLFLKELVDIASSQERAIVFSTHIVSDLERVATRVWLLQDGRIAVDSELDALKEQVVRIHLAPGVALPSAVEAKVVRERAQNGSRVVLCRDWDDNTQLGNGALIERLPLEEIFLELHA